MTDSTTIRRASADPASPVVDLAAYRAARMQDQLPLFDERSTARPAPVRRVLSSSEVAHRERMLGHLKGLKA